MKSAKIVRSAVIDFVENLHFEFDLENDIYMTCLNIVVCLTKIISIICHPLDWGKKSQPDIWSRKCNLRLRLQLRFAHAQ